jgi:hypothetical protein
MSEKKQNSIEWLFNQMSNVLAGYVTELTTQEILDQAKEMRQKELKESYDNGYANGQMGAFTK